MKYKVPPAFDPEGADKRQSAWSAFQQSNAGKPGMPQGNSFKSPRKPFNPNMPGSNRPEDGGRARPTVNVPPTRPRGPPPTSSPETPISPKTQRPRPDPLRPFRDRAPNDQIPFAEGNRVSTPYTKSFIGEKTDFFGEGLRRSYSTRDTSKLSPEDGSNRARARSTSPPRTSNDNTPRQTTFEMPISSEESASDPDMTRTPEEVDGSPQDQQRPGTAPNMTSPFARPKKVPMPPSSRFNGTRSGPASPRRKANGATGRAQSDSEQPEMQQQSRSNMYADPSDSSSPLPSSSFSSQAWTSQMFGSYSTSSAGRDSSKVPKWAIPSSLNPVLRCDKQDDHNKNSFVTAADERFVNATKDEQNAYLRFQSELRKEYEHVPDNLDMDVFLKLALMARKDESSGDALLDRIMIRVLLDFETVGLSQNDMADEGQCTNSFDFTPEPDPYAADNARSRSEENINTTFSPDGWTGAFTGEPDYFAPPPNTGRKQPSPTRRPTNNKAPASQSRGATMDDYHTNAPYEEVPQRPWGSDGTPGEFQRAAPADTGFDKEGWERTFQDPTWTWPPPPPNPPSPGKGGASSRKQNQSRKASKPRRGNGTKTQPHVVDGDDSVENGGADARPETGAAFDDGDAMDIDDMPPPQQTYPQQDGTPAQSNDQERGARVYSVPPSEWRQQQEQKQRSHRKTSSASRRSQRGTANGGTKFNANLDDLRDSLAQSTGRTEGLNLADMGSSLPFQSQTSATMYGDPLLPRDLVVPPVPKPPAEPQRLSKTSWQAYAAAFGEYVKSFHNYNTTLLQHFVSRERQAQAHISGGTSWLEATGDTSGMLTAPTGFGTYMRGVKEDEKVREGWTVAWEKHTDAIRGFQNMRERVRRLVVSGMLVEN